MRLQEIETELTAEADFTESAEFRYFNDIQFRLFGKDYQAEIAASWCNVSEPQTRYDEGGSFSTNFKIEEIELTHYDDATSEDIEETEIAEMIKNLYK